MYIIHKRQNGKVSITSILDEMSLEEAEAHAERIHAEPMHSDFISYRIITDKSLIPEDRAFRDAWTDDNNTLTVDVDLAKAQEIQKNKWRELRAPKLQDLDILYMKAQEQGDSGTLSVIINQKQALRNVTKLSMPADLEQLKNYIPSILQ